MLRGTPDGPKPFEAEWRTLGNDGDLGDALEAAEAVGRALRESLNSVLRRLPPGVATVAEVARHLGLNRSICQRVVLGVRDAQDGLGVIERFPGVRGLEQFLEAAVDNGCPAGVAAAARRAVESYARLVSHSGGSQSRLVGRIEAHRGDAPPPDAPAAAPEQLDRWRRLCHEGAVGLTGLSSAARVDLVIVGPAAGGRGRAAGRVTTVNATVMAGIQAAPYAMPLTRRSRLAGLSPVPQRDALGRVGAAGGVTPDLLLRDFTTRPLPRVTTRTEGEMLIQIFDPDRGGDGGPFDVAAALAFGWTWGQPRGPDSDYYTVGRVIGPPARRLVLDVYLHRGLPPPREVAAHVLRPGATGSLGDARPRARWFDRLPLEHDLTLLAGRPGDRPSDAYPRLGELTRSLVDSMGWAETDFAGYRLEVEYPLFDMEYVVAFEF